MNENRLFRIIKNDRIISVLGFAILFMSCEGYRCAEGRIYDAATGAPIDSVQCVVLTGRETGYSDSTGYFYVCNKMDGCVPDCPDIEVQFIKSGYKPKTIKNRDGENIYLEKE